MDCPKLTFDSIFTTECSSEVSFTLSQDEWWQMVPTYLSPNRLQNNWTKIIAKHLQLSNPFCSFIFDRHYVQKQNSRKRCYKIYFKANGRCIFENCSCRFTLAMSKDDFHQKIVHVKYTCSIKHTNCERKSRAIKGEKRAQFREEFCSGPLKPSVMYQKRKLDVFPDAMASGNTTGCGNKPETMRKIASEGKQLLQQDKDLSCSLEKIRRTLLGKETTREFPKSKAHDGFVHTIAMHPLIVPMGLENEVRLWHGGCKNDISYLDATGTLVADHNGKRVLYYALVIRHPVENEPSFPVAEMITSDHTTGNIHSFLERFRRDESKLYRGNLSSPRQVNTDYSRALLMAVLQESNNESRAAFFKRAFRIVNGRSLDNDLALIVPHVGCSHFMHIVHRYLKK
ncbi:uncharacterized protein LOC124438735 [Xenia sp. Carnegie-2017]|uniref:uncharacterized protein LOC124438735 n=1 Tax=Xenia sp. Carnegie-2017 TaxID=2897299 RepID=UPI001F037AB3|nr:uncharacterized protein LOC124438735 [Xenia sp. Carnegie-2017]